MKSPWFKLWSRPVDATERVPPFEKKHNVGGPRFIVAGISCLFQRPFKVLSLVAAGAFMQACAPNAPATTNAVVAVLSAATNAPEEDYLNPGAPIQVEAGRRFSIRIKSNPTTGYGWQLAKPPAEAVVVLVTNAYVPQANLQGMAGVGGHEVWTFRAVGAGQAEIALNYVRPWEKDKPPADTNVFTVIVK